MTLISSFIEVFFDRDGEALENGYIYVGEAGMDARTNPIQLYWDEALTITAAQPIRTSGGYPVYQGAPSGLFMAELNCSITVLDEEQRFVLVNVPGGLAETNIEFIQGGTGAVTRTAQNKMRERVSVLDYGATGDGVTDDTAAIQNAIDYVGSLGGGEVFFPAGEYNITDTLSLTESGVVLQGESRSGVILSCSVGTIDAIYMEGLSAPGVYSCAVRDMTIDASVSKTAGSAIRQYRANESFIERVNINNHYNGIDCKTINNNIIAGVVVTQVLGDFALKFWSIDDGTERSDVLTVTDTVFQLNNNGGDGIVWLGFAHTLRLARVGVLSANFGMLIQNSSGGGSYYPSFGEFVDLEIDGTNSSAVKIEGGGNMVFTGCDLFSLGTATEPLVDIEGDLGASFTSGITFTGGRIYGGAAQAIRTGCRNLVINGVRMGGGTTTGSSCIEILDESYDFIITNNAIGTTWGSATGKYDYGISLAADTYRGIIANNSFYGCIDSIDNGSTTDTVQVELFLNEIGIPNWPNTILRRCDDNNGTFEHKVENVSTDGAAQALYTTSTNVANTFRSWGVHNGAGTPYCIENGGSAVTVRYNDCDEHQFRTQGAIIKLYSTTSFFRPGPDNSVTLGGASNRWSEVFAGTGTINTSDKRLKKNIGAIPDKWLDAWEDVEWCRFRFKDGNRWHAGLIAQQVHDAFAKHGLDATEIGLCCYDEWEDQYDREFVEREVEIDGVKQTTMVSTGKQVLIQKAGDRWGLRYDECQAMESAWQRREIERLRKAG